MFGDCDGADVFAGRRKELVEETSYVSRARSVLVWGLIVADVLKLAVGGVDRTLVVDLSKDPCRTLWTEARSDATVQRDFTAAACS